MRKLIFIISLLISSVQFVSAQKDIKATQILEKVSKNFAAVKSVSADFSLTIENKAANLSETEKGKVFLQGKSFRLEMAEQDLFSDGQNLYTLLKEVNEVQITTYKPQADEITPFNIFTIYEKGFDYYFIDEKLINGVKIATIDLIPTDKTKAFFKIRLQVDATKNQLISARIFEKSGTEYFYQINNIVTNKAIPSTKFVFQKSAFPGIEIIDLRKK